MYGRWSPETSAWWIVTIEGWVDIWAMTLASESNWWRTDSSSTVESSTLIATRRCGRAWRYRNTSAKPPEPSRVSYS